MDRRTRAVHAVKSISKARIVTPQDAADIRTEIEILHLISPHQNLAGLLGVYEDREAVHLVMQYCAGGELFDRIVSKGTFSEAEAARFFREMVEVIAHLHACGVMHRDIKPENFLLSDRTDDASLLACDFGLGAFFKPGERLSTLVGSPYYVAPEVLRRSYGPKADIWSLGVVIYILLSGIPPFWGPTDKEIFVAILRGTPDMEAAPWPSVSEPAKSLVRRLLTLDPEQRPTVAELLQDPWLKEQGAAPERPLDSVVVKRMKRFAALEKVRKAAILMASKHLNHEEIHGLEELFKSFDKVSPSSVPHVVLNLGWFERFFTNVWCMQNGDGQISLQELREGLAASCGPNVFDDSEIEAVMHDADCDGSGTIDYHEFLASTVNRSLLEREDVLLKLFRELDTDGSGTLDISEIEAALGGTHLGKLDPDEVLELMRSADKNGDGVIDFQEFVEEWRRRGAGGAADVLKRGLPSTIEHMELE